MADEEDHRTPPAPQSPARRRHWPAVTAGVACVALLAGGVYGGAALLRDDSGSAADGPGQQLLVLDSYGDGGAAAAAGTAEAAAAADALWAMPWVRYEAAGELPGAPGDAPVHRFPGTEVDAAAAAELAGALGVAGTPERRDAHWYVAEDDGPSLTVGVDAPGDWYLSGYGAVEVLEDAVTSGAGSGSSTGQAPADGEAASPGEPPAEGVEEPWEGGLEDAPYPEDGYYEDPWTGDPIGEKEALGLARPLLERLGMGDAEVDASNRWGDVRSVTVTRTHEGMPVEGWYASLEFGPDGDLRSASGSLGVPEPGEDYPLIGAADALDLLNENGGMGGFGYGAASSDAAASDGAGAGRGVAEPAVPEDGTPPADADEPTMMPVEPMPPVEPAEPEVHTVTGAVLGLSLDYSRGEPLLVPSWLYTVRNASFEYRVSHPAIDPDYLSTPDPSTAPDGREPGGPEEGPAEEIVGRGATAPDAGGPVRPEPGSEPAEEAGEPPAPSYVVAEGPGDRSLTYHFMAGVCGTYTGVAEESGEEIVVRVEYDPGETDMCILVAEATSVEVALDAPLGDRAVLDESGMELEVR